MVSIAGNTVDDPNAATDGTDTEGDTDDADDGKADAKDGDDDLDDELGEIEIDYDDDYDPDMADTFKVTEVDDGFAGRRQLPL